MSETPTNKNKPSPRTSIRKVAQRRSLRRSTLDKNSDSVTNTPTNDEPTPRGIIRALSRAPGTIQKPTTTRQRIAKRGTLVEETETPRQLIRNVLQSMPPASEPGSTTVLRQRSAVTADTPPTQLASASPLIAGGFSLESQKSKASQSSQALNIELSTTDKVVAARTDPEFERNVSEARVTANELLQVVGAQSQQSLVWKKPTTKRKAKKRKQTSAPVAKRPRRKEFPVYPKAHTRQLFSNFAKGAVVSSNAQKKLLQYSEQYWKHTCDTVTAFANHAAKERPEETLMVREEDVELLFKRQRLINETKDIDTLIRDHLPAEFRRDVLPIARAQNIADPRV